MIMDNFNLDVEIEKWGKKIPFHTDDEILDDRTYDAIARHFFELGMKYRNDLIVQSDNNQRDNKSLYFRCTFDKEPDNFREYGTIYTTQSGQHVMYFTSSRISDEPILRLLDGDIEDLKEGITLVENGETFNGKNITILEPII